MTDSSFLGADTQTSVARSCGVCGVWQRLSKTHVPPRAAGNTGAVTRARVRLANQLEQLGREDIGGMWVRGLCTRCNSLAGGRTDAAYADFARGLTHWRERVRYSRVALPVDVPDVTFSPGRVARAVLYGMFAIAPNLRTQFPEIGEALARGDDHIRMPSSVQLLVAQYYRQEGLLSGGIFAMRVLERMESYNALAEVYFPPLAWVLVAQEDRALRDRGYVPLTESQRWARADDWTLYGDDRNSINLRWLARTMPTVRHPVYGENYDSWIRMTGGDSTILRGRVPG